jgi:phytoene desaturase
MMSAKMTARVIAKDYGIPDSIVRRVPESLQMV